MRKQWGRITQGLETEVEGQRWYPAVIALMKENTTCSMCHETMLVNWVDQIGEQERDVW